MDISNLKKIIENDKDAKFIIVENGKPGFVLMSFESYYKLLAKNSQLGFNSNEEPMKPAGDDSQKINFGERSLDELEILRNNGNSVEKEVVDIENLTI